MIGPLLSLLAAWLHKAREKFKRDSRNPYIKSDLKTFGFSEAHKLPGLENDAVALSESKIAGKDYESAKQVLINAWLLIPAGESGEIAYMRLREGFASLYLAKGDSVRAARIASMPIMLLDGEVQWIVTHPHEQIGGSAIGETEGATGEQN